MPSWNEVLVEIQSCPRIDALDFVRRKYLLQLYEKTGRNIITYYSGWLQKPRIGNADICDDDKNGLMATIHNLDRSKGLDLILHTPGGDIAATESIVDYLRRMFGNDIRAIIPQIAMSAGTMIACSCKEIIMGKQSNIGPIDPQFNGIPVLGVLAEFKRALKEIREIHKLSPWQTVVAKYHPTFIGECQNAIDWSTEIVTKWLEINMFNGDKDPKMKAATVVENWVAMMIQNTARHIHIDEAKFWPEDVLLEADFPMIFRIPARHHAFMHTLQT